MFTFYKHNERQFALQATELKDAVEAMKIHLSSGFQMSTLRGEIEKGDGYTGVKYFAKPKVSKTMKKPDEEYVGTIRLTSS